jgi:hypothetical protein
MGGVLLNPLSQQDEAEVLLAPRSCEVNLWYKGDRTVWTYIVSRLTVWPIGLLFRVG